MSWNQVVVGLSDLLMLAQAESGAGDGGAPAGAADAAKGEGGNPLIQLAPMLAIGVFFYFIVLRPQMKAQKDKQKQHEDLLSNLKKNDKVVTIGGIIGTVADVNDERVTLKIDDNTRMKFTRGSIQGLYGEKQEDSGQ